MKTKIIKKISGEAMMEAVIATALFGVLSYGVGYGLNKNASAQREANIQNLTVKSVREDLNAFGAGVMQGCDQASTSVTSTSKNLTVLKDTTTNPTQGQVNNYALSLSGVTKKCLMKTYAVSITDASGTVVSKDIKLPTVAYNVNDSLIKNSGDMGATDPTQ